MHVGADAGVTEEPAFILHFAMYCPPAGVSSKEFLDRVHNTNLRGSQCNLPVSPFMLAV
jgi:hypothetical protein